MRVNIQVYQLRLLLFFTALVFLCACSPSRLSTENLNSRFSYGSDLLNPAFAVYHRSADTSEVFIRIPENGLLYKASQEGFVAGLSVRWSVHSSYSSKEILDSGTVAFEARSNTSSGAFDGSFRFHLDRKSAVVLRLEVVDVNRQVSALHYQSISAAGTLSPQDFLVMDSSGNVLCRNTVRLNETIWITPPYRQVTWKVRCYYRNFPLAYLPFRVIEDPVFEMASDSFFTVDLNPERGLSFPKPGIYFVQEDTNVISGLTFMCFDSDFPMLTQAQQLLEATRYLTTRKEYERLKAMEDKKKAVDQFWVETGGNYERARMLIRAYYNRVQEANKLYTSYLEGWKTDRGMIHMIFGRPQSIYRDEETEQWSYNGIPGFPEMIFVFRKMNNPFSNNDYALIRQPAYENVWFMAVDQWRQGRVVNDN